MVNKIDSNLTSFAYAEESSLKTLPGSPIWYGIAVNSYSDFGGDVEKISRSPIDGTRQSLKGSVSHVSAKGGISVDVARENISRLMQGFFFADAYEYGSSLPFTGTQRTFTAVAAGTGVYTGTTPNGIFAVNNLVRCSGFTDPANNGVFKVTAVSGTTVTVNNSASVSETPAATAKIEVVGHEFATGDLVQTIPGDGTFKIASTAAGSVFTNVQIGSWVFIGGDAAGTSFATGGSGYARVSAKPTNALVFDKSTYTPVADTGSGKTIRMYFSRFFKNATSSANIVTRSYQLERQLGNDGSGTQSEYVVGAVPNEFKLTMKMKEMVTADLSFVGMDSENRTGATGVKSGTRISDYNEAGYNASDDVYRICVAPVNSGTINPTVLLGFVTDCNLTVNNNVSGLDAIGYVGSVDINVGSFDVSGDIEVYFATIAAANAIRANGNVTFDAIMCGLNSDGSTYAGKVYDIPLLDLSGGMANVTKDQPIKLPVSQKGVKNSNSYTLSLSEFVVLPALAAPTT